MTLKRFDLKYGSGSVSVDIPMANLAGVIAGKPKADITDVGAAVREAIRNPIDSPPLGEVVMPGERVAILVSDLTRGWCRSDAMVPTVVDELRAHGVSDSDMTIVVAVGTHRAQNREEHAMLVTPAVMDRIKVVEHNCKTDSMAYLGTTRFGTPVSINEQVASADRIILTGGVVTHDLAGYGGGMKSILPGVASYETIMAHHKVSLGKEPGTINEIIGCGRTAGNTFYEDIVEAGLMAKPDFLINTVMSPSGNVSDVVAGNPLSAHLAGQKAVDDNFNVDIHELADLVIVSCGGFPMDINFYQSTKSLHNALPAVKPGGTVVLVAESRESFGHPYMEYIATQFGSNVERYHHLETDYDIGKFIGFMTTVYAGEYNVILLSSLTHQEVVGMGIKPAHSMDEAMRLVYNFCGPAPRTYVIPNGLSVWPVLKSR